MKLETAAVFISKILEARDDRFVDHKSLAREIGITIFEIASTKSGFVSKTLCDEDGFRKGKHCEEHYHSRQKSGDTLINMSETGPLKFDKLCTLLKEFSKVHLVTSQENIDLSPIQNGFCTRDLSWEEQYKLAGLELVEDKGTAPSWYWKTYNIEGKSFPSIRKANEGLELMGYGNIRKRCNAKSKCWSEWTSYLS